MGTKDVILAKTAIIRNCLAMIQRVTQGDSSKLDDQVTQDVFVLNLERAAQASIDIAMAIIAHRGLMLPNSYGQAFFILQQAGLLTSDIAQRMKKMAGFRNIAVHDYQQLDLAILKSIADHHLIDFEKYCGEIAAISLEN